MLQIDTSKYDKERWKDIEIGGNHFRFRELGAGEMMAYTQKAERAQKLSSKSTLTEAETSEMANIASSLIRTALDMFEDPTGKGKVESVIGQYSALDLFSMVNDIRQQIKNGSSEKSS